MSVLCFGETLWDIVEGERCLGGAPLNVAYHLGRFGVPVRLVSAVGCEALGDEALAQIARAGVDVGLIRRHPSLTTGTAGAALTATGEPTFLISDPAAWDAITDTPDDLARLVATEPPSVLVFGTLALRHAANRRTLQVLLDALPSARPVCDVNLRAPYDLLPDDVTGLLRRAWMLKVNAGEALRLSADAPGSREPEARARAIRARWQVPVVCVTDGHRGAGILVEDAWITVPAVPVTVVDTIGSGDAFTARLVVSMLREGRVDWLEALAHAASLAGFVASRRGAQPPYDPSRFLAG